MSFAQIWYRRSRPAFGSRLWFKTWAKRALNAPSLIRILVRVARLRRAGASIGELTVLNARLLGRKSNLTCGKGCAIGDAKFALHAPLVIGDNVAINDDVRILTASHHLDDPDWTLLPKPITICDYAWISEGAMLLPGVTVGRGAVVGARAVVTRDVEPFTVVVGNPARKTRTTRSQDLRYQPSAFLAELEAWLGPPTRHSASPARPVAVAAASGTGREQ